MCSPNFIRSVLFYHSNNTSNIFSTPWRLFVAMIMFKLAFKIRFPTKTAVKCMKNKTHYNAESVAVLSGARLKAPLSH